MTRSRRRWPPAAAPLLVVAGLVALSIALWHLRANDEDGPGGARRAGVAEASLDPMDPADAEQLAQAGRDLSRGQAQRLEARLAAREDDLVARTQLIGYWAGAGLDAEARERLGRHVAWVARHAPEAAVLGTPWARLTPADAAWGEIEAALMEHAEARAVRPAALKHAAHFFGPHAPERALTLLERGAALEPGNPEWAFAIGRIEAAVREAWRRGEARVPAEEASALSALVTPGLLAEAAGVPFQDLADAALRALNRGESARAAAFAAQAIERARHHVDHHAHGWVVHQANVVLGHLALRQDQVALAEAHLREATRVLRSPRLTGGGPDTTLAAALLARGRRDAVLQYLERVGHLWPAGRERGHLARWRADVKEGRVPVFDQGR